MTGVEKAINIAGDAKTLAEKVGVTYEAVRLWKKKGVVPHGNVFDVVDATGVSCFELNPIVYPIARFNNDCYIN